LKRSAVCKAGAASLSVLYFLTNCALVGAVERNSIQSRKNDGSTTVFASLPARVSTTIPRLAGPAVAAPLPDLLSRLPASLGTVRSVARQATGAAVVYIQDVHKNEEAQRRISDAVRALIDGGADLIALEGASGPIDVSAFRSSAFPESARRAADGLLADGRISGAALGAILAGREARVIGVEDPALYDANVAAVREASRSEKNARLRLDTRRRHLSDEKAEAFSPALAAFDALVQSYRAGRMGIGAYAAAVAQGAQAVPTNVTNFLEAAR